MDFSFVTEIALTVLLMATLIYCVLLERKLSSLRKNQDGLKQTIGKLNDSIVSASVAMRTLKSIAANAGETLDERIGQARALADELSLLTTSGERIAERIDRGTPTTLSPKMNGIHPAVLAGRLEALRGVR